MSEDVVDPSRAAEPPRDADEVRVWRIMEEIVSTERSYEGGLAFVIKNYLVAMRESQLVKPEHIDTIFCNITEVARISHDLLAALDVAHASSFSPPHYGIGAVFSRFADDIMREYAKYIASHHAAIACVKMLTEKKPKFEGFCSTVHDLPESCGRDLLSFLITPVQRLLRYSLLLSDLTRHMPESHPDRPHALAVLARVDEQAAAVNESIRADQNYAKLRAIRASLGSGLSKEVGDIVMADHTFIREGFLTKVCRKSDLRRFFWLFSDVLLYGSPYPTGNSFVYHRHFFTSKIRVKAIADSDDVKNAFQIIAAEKSFTVFADTLSEKSQWIADLQNACAVVQKDEERIPEQKDIAGEEAPVWVPDKKALRCMICGCFFNMVKRRHHCRNCGKVVCGDCSARKLLLPHLGASAPERVCKFCYDFILIDNPSLAEQSMAQTQKPKAKPQQQKNKRQESAWYRSFRFSKRVVQPSPPVYGFEIPPHAGPNYDKVRRPPATSAESAPIPVMLAHPQSPQQPRPTMAATATATTKRPPPPSRPPPTVPIRANRRSKRISVRTHPIRQLSIPKPDGVVSSSSQSSVSEPPPATANGVAKTTAAKPTYEELAKMVESLTEQLRHAKGQLAEKEAECAKAKAKKREMKNRVTELEKRAATATAAASPQLPARPPVAATATRQAPTPPATASMGSPPTGTGPSANASSQWRQAPVQQPMKQRRPSVIAGSASMPASMSLSTPSMPSPPPTTAATQPSQPSSSLSTSSPGLTPKRSAPSAPAHRK